MTTRFSTRYHLLSLLLFSAVIGGANGCGSGTETAKPDSPEIMSADDPQVGSSETDYIAMQGSNPRVTVSLPDSLLEGSPDDTIMVPVRLSIVDGSRMYTDKEYDLPFQPVPLSITVGGDKHLKQAGKAIFDAIPVVLDDPHFNAKMEYWVGNVILYVPVVVDGKAGRTYDQARVAVEFMTCDDAACYPPSTVKLPFTIKTVADEDDDDR